MSNGWTPSLEFADAANAYVNNENTTRFGGTSGASVLYYDNRYWTMWKLVSGAHFLNTLLSVVGRAAARPPAKRARRSDDLISNSRNLLPPAPAPPSLAAQPMFGCTDGSQVVKEIGACRKAFPEAYVRLVAFDPIKQVQVAGFLVNRPSSVKDFQAPDKRSV